MTMPVSFTGGPPSWQARLASAYYRLVLRRHVPGGHVDVAKLRRRFGQPRAMRRLFAGRCRVTKTGAPVPGEWLDHPSGGEGGRVVLYLHGGGYLFCSAETHRPITAALAAMARARVFSLEYRRAPEHPFPAAVDDAVAAVRWLYAQGVSPALLTVGGDSAGGGLTLATLLVLRDAGDPLPAGAFLFSPWTDLAATGASITENDGRCAMFYPDGIRSCAALYHGAASPTHPLVSPLYAELHGLPPLLAQVSDSELLRDDTRRLVDKVRAAGGTAVLQAWPDLPHVWQLFATFVPEARVALSQAAAFIVACTPAGGGTRVYSGHDASPDRARAAVPADGGTGMHDRS